MVGGHQNKGGQGTFPVLIGDVSSDGSLIAQVIHEPVNSVRLKFQGQSKGRQWAGAQLEVRGRRRRLLVVTAA